MYNMYSLHMCNDRVLSFCRSGFRFRVPPPDARDERARLFESTSWGLGPPFLPAEASRQDPLCNRPARCPGEVATGALLEEGGDQLLLGGTRRTVRDPVLLLLMV